MLSVKQTTSSTIFWVIGTTGPGIGEQFTHKANAPVWLQYIMGHNKLYLVFNVLMAFLFTSKQQQQHQTEATTSNKNGSNNKHQHQEIATT